MIEDYEGLCALINKNGVCHQYRWLREFSGGQRGPDLVAIEVAPGVSVNSENLFDARLAIVRRRQPRRRARTLAMHDLFYQSLSEREETRE